MNAKAAIRLLKQTYKRWSEHNAPRLGASVAFYTLLSFANSKRADRWQASISVSPLVTAYASSRNWCRLPQSEKKLNRLSSVPFVTRVSWLKTWRIPRSSGQTAPMLHLKTRDSEAIGESEQVLEISKPARSGRREMLADIVLSNELAEAVAEIQMA